THAGGGEPSHRQPLQWTGPGCPADTGRPLRGTPWKRQVGAATCRRKQLIVSWERQRASLDGRGVRSAVPPGATPPLPARESCVAWSLTAAAAHSARRT